jgi:hypothetical protein
MRFKTKSYWLVGSVIAMLTIGLFGCAGRTPGGSDKGVPTTQPYIIGEITKIEGGRILIETSPGKQIDNKSWLAISEATRLFKQDGKLVSTIAAQDLAVGQRVSAWVSGPVMESYPTQGGADAVLVH